MSVNQLQQEQTVRLIAAQDPLSSFQLSRIFGKNTKGQNKQYLSLNQSINDFQIGGRRNFDKRGRNLQKFFENSNDFKNIKTAMNDNTISDFDRQSVSPGSFKYRNLLKIAEHYLQYYDEYAIIPDPNFVKDVYEKAIISLQNTDLNNITTDIIKIVTNIFAEIEVITPTKLINDIRTIKMSQSTAPSLQVSSVQTLTAPDLTVLRQQFQRPAVGQQFDIEKDVKDYNNYVLYQLANKQSIDTDFINEMKRKYPFIFNDTYERNILGYNGIINSGIVRSNINVDYKDLVLPIPSYVEFAKQKQPVNIQSEQNIQNVLSRGYQIIANKGKEVKDEFLSFKQKGQNQFEGKYIHPKLKGSFSVTYNPRYNEYKIVNRNYPTGFVKSGYGIYSYINSLVKKQEKAKQAAPYMPRISVDYQ